eukprot:PhF_6_TR33722/c1_g3_i3/m.49512
MRLRILNTLNVLRMVPLHCNRMEYFVSLIPEATFLVDTFPVNSRGPPNLFNGKYKGKCRKYQLCSSLEGTPLSVIRCKTEIQEAIEDAYGDDDIHDRTHDGTILKRWAPGCLSKPRGNSALVTKRMSPVAKLFHRSNSYERGS